MTMYVIEIRGDDGERAEEYEIDNAASAEAAKAEAMQRFLSYRAWTAHVIEEYEDEA